MSDLARAFPELDRIEDVDLRAGVERAWTTAMADAGVDDLAAVPWFPPAQRDLDLPDERLVPHVRDVTAGALALADALADRRWTVDRDVVLAGALVHDVSKLYEFERPHASEREAADSAIDGAVPTRIYELLGHPHYGLHVVAAAGLPVEIQHVVLAHTDRTAVEPRTLEAEIVRRADEVAAAAIRSRAE
ncbi:MAG: HD domain-containing protein [Haloarculaceae archaeon]